MYTYKSQINSGYCYDNDSSFHDVKYYFTM